MDSRSLVDGLIGAAGPSNQQVALDAGNSTEVSRSPAVSATRVTTGRKKRASMYAPENKIELVFPPPVSSPVPPVGESPSGEQGIPNVGSSRGNPPMTAGMARLAGSAAFATAVAPGLDGTAGRRKKASKYASENKLEIVFFPTPISSIPPNGVSLSGSRDLGHVASASSNLPMIIGTECLAAPSGQHAASEHGNVTEVSRAPALFATPVAAGLATNASKYAAGNKLDIVFTPTPISSIFPPNVGSSSGSRDIGNVPSSSSNLLEITRMECLAGPSGQNVAREDDNLMEVSRSPPVVSTPVTTTASSSRIPPIREASSGSQYIGNVCSSSANIPMIIGTECLGPSNQRMATQEENPIEVSGSPAVLATPVTSGSPTAVPPPIPRMSNCLSGNLPNVVGMEWSGHVDGGSDSMRHVITVNAGEDVTSKVLSFSVLAPRPICVVSATGALSLATMRHRDSPGNNLTYVGRFQILSLCGCFTTSESQGTSSRSWEMSICLSGSSGRVLFGSVSGTLIAASPVQVVVWKL